MSHRPNQSLKFTQYTISTLKKLDRNRKFPMGIESIFSDSKSCLSGLNWPRSGKNSEFLALFWLVEGTLGIGWK